MEHDEGKIDKMVRVCVRGRDKIGAAMERLYKAGYIADPQNKAKSVRMAEAGTGKIARTVRTALCSEGLVALSGVSVNAIFPALR